MTTPGILTTAGRYSQAPEDIVVVASARGAQIPNASASRTVFESGRAHFSVFTHLWSQVPHMTASSAQHTSVAGAAVHTSQKVFIFDEESGWLFGEKSARA